MRVVEALLVLLMLGTGAWYGLKFLFRSDAPRWEVAVRSVHNKTLVCIERGSERVVFRTLSPQTDESDFEIAMIDARIRRDSMNATSR